MEILMNYAKLVADVAVRARLTDEVVREVLFFLPDALLQLDVGDNVRTPLGVFRMAEGKERQITLPDGVTQATVPAKVQVKLRPGTRLKLIN